MAAFTISTLAGKVLAELPLDDAAPDLVIGDLLERLPPPDGAGGVPRLLLGARELEWAERVADLALAPGAVVTLVLVADPRKAAADLLGTVGTSVRLAAVRVLRGMGLVAKGHAEALVDAALSDSEAEVASEALQALRAMGAAVEPAAVAIAQLAQDLEDPCVLFCCGLHSRAVLKRRLLALLEQRCDASPGQAALRGRTVLRRLAALDPEAARRHEPLLADPLDDPRSEVRLARVAVLGHLWRADYEEDRNDACRKLCGLVVGDACLGVRDRAAAIVGRARRHYAKQNRPVPRPLEVGLALAHAGLAAEVVALQRSALPGDRCRMEAIQSIKQLLG